MPPIARAPRSALRKPLLAAEENDCSTAAVVTWGQLTVRSRIATPLYPVLAHPASPMRSTPPAVARQVGERMLEKRRRNTPPKNPRQSHLERTTSRLSRSPERADIDSRAVIGLTRACLRANFFGLSCGRSTRPRRRARWSGRRGSGQKGVPGGVRLCLVLPREGDPRKSMHDGRYPDAEGSRIS